MKKTFEIKNLDCAVCAGKVADTINKLPEIDNAQIDFLTKKLSVESTTENWEKLMHKVIKTCHKIEPDCEIVMEESAHHHCHHNDLNKLFFIRIAITVVLGAFCFIADNETLKLIAALIAYFVIGYDVLWRAIRNIFRGQVFDENFLMTIATVGAFFIREYPEAIAVMLFYQIGEAFQEAAVDKSRKSIADLMNIRPDKANVCRDGQIITVNPEDVAVGEEIVIRPGERIALDGVIISGKSSVNTAALTGESLPVDVEEGGEVIGGCVNISGLLKVRTTKLFSESSVARILDLVEKSAANKAKSEKFITRFARYYTPFVVLAAVCLAVLPSLLFGNWQEWLQRALVFLIISCPCALVISVPLSFFGGIGGASKKGILVKGAEYLEKLAQCKTVVFDKTGTLTKGQFVISHIKSKDLPEDELLEIAAAAQWFSNHPISQSIKNKYGKMIDEKRISKSQELAGHGVHAVVDGKDVYAGNKRLMEQIGVICDDVSHVGTEVHLAIDGKYAGYILISDEVREEAAFAVNTLKRMGIKKTVMLTGDRREAGEAVAELLKIDEAFTQLLPEHKVECIERLEVEGDGPLMFVGDGINDAPVLARADVAVAMGGLGSDAAIEAADIVLMEDTLSRLATAVKIARKTMVIVRENIVLALGIKMLILILGAFGFAGMWLAVFADVGVSVIAILNAMRTLR
jgi:Cd2+/Zn2+-exporting ATPase